MYSSQRVLTAHTMKYIIAGQVINLEYGVLECKNELLKISSSEPF